MTQSVSLHDHNKMLVRESFDRWSQGSGSPFELLMSDAQWTIVGSSPLSKTYHSRQQFLDEVIHPFNARMQTPLTPVVREIFADGDAVIALFDASGIATDGVAYNNTYTWYFWIRNDKIFKAIAFFDTRDFDEFWHRIKL